jgi:hypothetical protein
MDTKDTKVNEVSHCVLGVLCGERNVFRQDKGAVPGRSWPDEIAGTQWRGLSWKSADAVEGDADTVRSCPHEPARAPGQVERLQRSGFPVFRIGLIFEDDRVSSSEVAPCVERGLDVRAHPIGHRLFRLRIAIRVHPADQVVGDVERPHRSARQMSGQPPAVAQRIVHPPLAIDTVVDLVIDPLIVPAPAFEHPSQRVFRPAHMTALDILILTLIANARPEVLRPDEEVDDVYGGDILRG